MPYKKYLQTDAWHEYKKRRYEYDGGVCVICHEKLSFEESQAHHINYARLGHEEIDDCITVCPYHHSVIHSNSKPVEYFRESDENHWNMYSLDDTAKLCGMFLKEDYWFGGNLNCCDQGVCSVLIDDYFRACEITVPPLIDPHDIQLYFRNKRYEVLFEAEKNGVDLNVMTDAGENFLDERFGRKGGKGGNPKRSQARSFMTSHDSESFHRNYWYLYQINILMQEVKKYEQA